MIPYYHSRLHDFIHSLHGIDRVELYTAGAEHWVQGEEMFHCYMRGVGISVTMDSFTSMIQLHRVDNTHGLVMEKKEISSTG